MNENINKLKELISSENDSYKKADLLNQLAGEYVYIDEKKVIEFADEALKIAKDIGYEKGNAESHIYLGEGYFYISEYQKAIINYMDALEYFRKIQELNKIGVIYNGLGKAYGSMGNYAKASDYFNESLYIFKKVRNLDKQASALNNLGTVVSNMERHEKALQYYKEAYEITKQYMKSDGCPIILLNIGGVMNRLGKYDSALVYLQKSLQLSFEQNYMSNACSCYGEIGLNYYKRHEFEESLKYYLKSMKIAEKNNYTFLEANNLMEMGDLFIAKGEEEKALNYYERGLKKAQEVNSKEIIFKIYHKLSQYYKKQEKYEISLKYFELFHEMKNEVMNEANELKVESIIIEHQVEKIKKESEIYQLKNVELKASFDRIKLINQIGKTITSTLNIDEITEKIYSAILQMMDTDMFIIAINKEKQGKTEYNIFSKEYKGYKTIYTPINDGIEKWCMLNKKEVLINDFNKEYSQYFSTKQEFLYKNNISSIVCVPLILENKSIGCVSVLNLQENAFTVINMETVKALASYIVIAINNARKSQELREKNEMLKKLSIIDELTGVYNRRYIYEKLNIIHKKVKNEDLNVIIIMIDIDNFKFINDNYGHAFGDEVLKKVSTGILNIIGGKGVVGRYGGDEFIIILENTDIEKAKYWIIKLQKIVHNFDFNNDIEVTLSGGMATLDKRTEVEDVLSNVDKLLYKVKKSGKNNIICD